MVGGSVSPVRTVGAAGHAYLGCPCRALAPVPVGAVVALTWTNSSFAASGTLVSVFSPCVPAYVSVEDCGWLSAVGSCSVMYAVAASSVITTAYAGPR